MNKNSPYYKQVELVIQCLPLIAKETCFALKGGTAINLFMHDFPRLSVDIDLTYLGFEAREEALSNIKDSLERITNDLISNKLNAFQQKNNENEMRIVVDNKRTVQDSAQIKIEVSPVARGTLHKAVKLDVKQKIEDNFGFATIQIVSRPDLYGGKLCAAMDRQHPRDLLDVKILLESQGINRDIFIGYLAYLLSHNRPISEVMNPKWKDISDTFDKEFKGMTLEPITLKELQAVPDAMVASLKSQFTQDDLNFLYSFKSGDPDWCSAPHKQIQHLPAVQWKLLNIRKQTKENRQASLVKLKNTMLGWLEK